jgi:hydrogenase-4 component B
MLTPEQAVVAAMLACLAGALLTLLVSRHKTLAGWLTFFVTAGSAILIFIAVARVLTDGPSLHPAAFWAIPKAGFALRIYVDGLTAVFLLLAAVIAVPAALYSILYMRHYQDYGVARYYPYFLLFLAAMYGLLSTTDMMWVFFIFWQLMALPGYALIRFEHRKRQNARAANKYLIMMQIACVAIMIGAGLLAATGRTGSALDLKYDFFTVSANLPLLLATTPGATALAFGLFLAGFGIAMGMWPFGQFWLPDAEPATPSPASAMLSGVMIKIGVYGLMRYFLWLVPLSAQVEYPLARWGMLVAALGTITLFTGTMQALKQEQSKRLLAFHSIGQIGYILLGIGTCMVLLAVNTPGTAALATIGFFGALFHVLNHGLFKGLLFLNAGSMLHATGTQDLNQMGGMMKYMPLTAITALVASFSISGVPLFNGFVSKWSIYVALIQGSGPARYLAVCAVIAILTSALTLASFIKFFGVSFLSRSSALVKARAAEAKNGRLEVPWLMQLPQLGLAFFCVLLGVVPAIGFRLMQRALEASRGGLGTMLANASPMMSGPLQGLASEDSAAVFVPVALASVLGLMFLLVYGMSKLGSAPRRAADPWLCGYVREADCHRYVAHNFYGEIKRYFGWLGGMADASNDNGASRADRSVRPTTLKGLP